MADFNLGHRPPDPEKVLMRIVASNEERVRQRWLVIFLANQHLMGALKLKTREIAAKTGYSPQQVRIIRNDYRDGGAEAIEMVRSRKRPHAGRKGALNKEEQKQLAGFMREQGSGCIWQDVKTYTHVVLGEPISDRTAQRYLKSFKEAQPQSASKRSSSKKVQARATSAKSAKQSEPKETKTQPAKRSEKPTLNTQPLLWSLAMPKGEETQEATTPEADEAGGDIA